jgi:hypothetical protein
MHYANLDTYLREATLTDACFLPIPVVAKWMGVTPPAVRAMLGRDVLSAVSIGGVLFVSSISLRTWQEDLASEVKKTLKVLHKAARKGRPISYSALLEKLDRDFTRPADRRRLAPLLEAASAQSLLDEGVLLGVWAYSKATEMPKYGVWDLADLHGLRQEGEGPRPFVDRMRALMQVDPAG